MFSTTTDPAKKARVRRAFAGDDVIAETPSAPQPHAEEAAESQDQTAEDQGGWSDGFMN